MESQQKKKTGKGSPSGKKQGEEKQKPDHIARFFRYRVQSLSGILSTDRPDGIVFAKIIR